MRITITALALALVVAAGCRVEPDGDGDLDADAEVDAEVDYSDVGEPCHLLSDCEIGLFCGADGLCYDPLGADTDADADAT